MTKTCGECKHFNAQQDKCLYNGRFYMSKSYFDACIDFEQRVITNGDKLRQMSNAEFAKLRVYHCPPVPAEFCKGRDTVKCVKCWLAWLNAPAESEGNNE